MLNARAPLPIIDSFKTKSTLPSVQAIEKCLNIATTADAAWELHDLMAKNVQYLKGAMKADGEVVLAELRGHATRIEEHEGRAETAPWNTGEVVTKLQSLREKLALESLQDINEQHIDFVFDINDESEFMRQYTNGQTQLDEQQTHAMDELFHSWLVNQGFLCQDGAIYEADSQGKIKSNERGQAVRAQTERVKELMLDRKNGFEIFVKNYDDNMQVNLQQYSSKAHVPQ